MWYVTNQKNDVSALGLSRVLGIHHETAWTWLHKLRRAMVRPDRDQLMGTVEVDETYVGGPEPGRPGRQTVTKAIVAIAVEVGGNDRLGRVRLAQVPNVTGPTLVGFVTDRVAGDGPVHTDAWPGYTGLSAAGYSHRVTNLSVRNAPTTVAMPAARRPPPAARRPPPAARRPPRRIAAQTVAGGYPPGLGRTQTPRLLPRRVLLPLQPA